MGRRSLVCWRGGGRPSTTLRPLAVPRAETEAELGGGEGSAAAAGGSCGASPAQSAELSDGATAVPLPPPDYASHKSSPKARTLSEKDAAAAAAAEWWTPSGAVTLLSVYVGRDWTVITQVRPALT